MLIYETINIMVTFISTYYTVNCTAVQIYLFILDIIKCRKFRMSSSVISYSINVALHEARFESNYNLHMNVIILTCGKKHYLICCSITFLSLLNHLSKNAFIVQ